MRSSLSNVPGKKGRVESRRQEEKEKGESRAGRYWNWWFTESLVMPVATVSVTLLSELVTPTIEFLTREEVPYVTPTRKQW
jgi:uncharacterized membrane protein